MREVFEMAPTGSGVNWFFGALILMFTALLALFLYLAWSTKNVSFELDAQALHLKGDLWSRSIPRSSLLSEDARLVDYHREPGLRPGRRTMGTGLPGYLSGWFKLRGGEKSLVYLSGHARPVYIPTTEGYSLMLTPENPERFLAALQRRGS
jgi:hypothetical protein